MKNLQNFSPIKPTPITSQIGLYSDRKWSKYSSLTNDLFINTCFKGVITQQTRAREHIHKFEEVNKIRIPHTSH